MWTHSQGVYPLRGDLAKVFRIEPQQMRCIHAEGAGCYGHNGADDVALDAALLARATSGRPVQRAVDARRRVHVGAVRLGDGDEARRAARRAGQRRELVHETVEPSAQPPARPAKGVNLLAARHLAQAGRAGAAADVPQPTGGSDRNAIPLYDFPSVKVVEAFHPRLPLRTSALRTLGRLRQRVRARVVHGRGGARRRRGSRSSSACAT